MTLTASIEGTDGIVYATDSRGTFGDPRGLTAQNDTMKKLYQVTKYSVVMIAGANQQGAMIMDEVQRAIEQGKIEGVTNVMQKIREVARTRYNEWLPNFPMVGHPNIPAPARPSLVVTVAGYDLENGLANTRRLYQILSAQDYAPNLFDFGFALGGVPLYATYLLNRLYTREMTIERLLPLAAYITKETASQDGKVGGDIQMCTITPAQGVKVLNNGEVNEVLKSNENKSKRLRELFWGEQHE